MDSQSNPDTLDCRTIETPVGSIPVIPISIKYSKTKKIISEIIEKLPELEDLITNAQSFRELREAKSKYTGEVNDTQREGIGKEVYNSGMIYYGQYSNNSQNGEGFLLIKITKDWKEYYKGSFKDGFFSGYGEYRCNKNYYKGEWMDNLKHGYGKERVGEIYYRGYFSFGAKMGQGKLKGKSGEFEGIFKDDEFNKGTYKDSNNEFVYEGRWKNGKFHGKGNLVYTNGPSAKIMTGKFQRGILNKGIIKFSDGTTVNLSTRI